MQFLKLKFKYNRLKFSFWWLVFQLIQMYLLHLDTDETLTLKQTALTEVEFNGLVKTSCNFRQRCNSATSPTPSTEHRKQKKKEKNQNIPVFCLELNDSFKKTPCSKSVQRKYIWDLHLKVHIKVIYTPPLIHILSLQVDFIQTQTLRKQKTKRGNAITSNILFKNGFLLYLRWPWSSWLQLNYSRTKIWRLDGLLL